MLSVIQPLTKKTVAKRAVGVAFLLAISFVAARADTVVITNGSIHGYVPGVDNPWEIAFSGSNFSVSVGGEAFHPRNVVLMPGQLVILFSSVPAVSGGPGAHSLLGSVVYNGVNYSSLVLPTITFSPLVFVAPLDTSTTTSVSVPFAITSGTVSFYSQFPAVPPIFSVDVVGHGIATINVGNYLGSFQVLDITYNFQPVPEPTTIFLLTAGLAGIAARRWYISR